MGMRGILLGILSFLIFVSGFVFLIALGGYSMLYPDVYINGLEKAGAFEMLESGLNSAPGASFIKIPSSGVKVLITPLLTNFLNYLRGESDELVLEVEIDSAKLRKFFLDSMGDVPACKTGENYSFDDLENLCKPAGKTYEEFLDELLEAKNLSFFESNFTDLAPVYGIEKGSPGRENLDNIRESIGYYQIGIYAAGLIILLLIFGIYFVSSLDLRRTARFAGVPILFAGLAVLMLVYFGFSYLSQFIANDSNLQIGGEFVASLVESAVGPFYTYSISASVIGMVLLVLSLFLPGKNVEKKIGMKRKKT